METETREQSAKAALLTTHTFMTVYLPQNFLVYYTNRRDKLQCTVFPIIRQKAPLLFVRFAQTLAEYRTEQGGNDDFQCITRQKREHPRP